MDRYFAVMQRVIEAHGGTVEKFIGDAVMAVFGIPVVHEDDALRAVRAAAEIRTAARRARRRTRGRAAARDPLPDRHQHRRGRRRRPDRRPVVRHRRRGQHRRAARAGGAAGRDPARRTRPTGSSATRSTVEPSSRSPRRARREPLRAYRLIAVDPDLAGHVRRLDAAAGRSRARAGGPPSSAFERVASERSCQLFTLLGTAGVGKSRLVAEFAAARRRARRRSCAAAACRYGEGITYWPIGEIVRTAAGHRRGRQRRRGAREAPRPVEGERDADALAARVASAIGLSIEPAPAGGGVLGDPQAPRAPRPRSAAGRRHRGHPLGRADRCSTSSSTSPTWSRGRADPAALPGPPRAARTRARVGAAGCSTPRRPARAAGHGCDAIA